MLVKKKSIVEKYRRGEVELAKIQVFLSDMQSSVGGGCY